MLRAGAGSDDAPDDLMARNDRQSRRDVPFDDVEIGAAYRAGIDFYEDFSRRGSRFRELDDVERIPFGAPGALEKHRFHDALFSTGMTVALKRVDALFADYGSHHRARGNLVCHAFGVTLIVFGVVSVLTTPRVGPVTAAEIVIALVVAYYATLDARLAVATTVAFGAIDLVARAVADWRIGLAAFVVGWIFQAVGHAVYEKKRPAFFQNLLHLLVGPIFLVNELLRIRRLAPA